MVKYMRDLFFDFGDDGPEITLTWAPREQARQRLAAEPKEGQQEQESIGIPGIAIYRTSVEKDMARFNMPAAAIGYDQGTFIESADPTYVDGPSPLANMLRIIPVVITYELVVWTRHMSDRNLIERELLFADIYKALQLKIETHKTSTVKVDPVTEPELCVDKTWTFMGGPQPYEEDWKDETGKNIWYGMSKEFLVFAEVVKSNSVPRITEIVTTYNEIVSGNPIDDVLLETIHVVPH